MVRVAVASFFDLRCIVRPMFVFVLQAYVFKSTFHLEKQSEARRKLSIKFFSKGKISRRKEIRIPNHLLYALVCCTVYCKPV